MNRLNAVAGATLLSLFAAGLVQKHRELTRLASTPPPPRGEDLQPEIRPVRTVDAMIGAYVSSAEAATPEEKLTHLGSLLASLGSPELEGETLEPVLADRLIALMADALGAPETRDQALWARAAAWLAERVPSRASRDFALGALDGPEPVRVAVLEKLGSPGGPRGTAIREKVRELAAKGAVPDELLPRVLRRTGGLKAKDELLKLLAESDGGRLIAGCAVSLQDYRDPELLTPVLERLEQVGMLEQGKMPWISPSLLSEHLKTADRPRFRRGMAAMAARPALVKDGIEHVERGLRGEDAETRRLAAVAVKRAVVGRLVDPKRGEDLLAGRLQVETEPVLKAELTGGLERVRSLIETGVQ